MGQFLQYLKLTLQRDEEGQTLAEYALILALIAIAVIVVLGLLGTEIGNIFTEITTELGGATGT